MNGRTSMDRYYSERLIRQFGFEKGVGLLNVLTARDLGMIPEGRVVSFLSDNIQFYADARKPTARKAN